jgi:short-subunit dehydrogenase
MFCQRGGNFVLVGRSDDKLQLLADRLAREQGVKTWIAPTDLSLAGSAAKLADKMDKLNHPIDILVNCTVRDRLC